METQVDLTALAGWMDGQGLGAGPIEDATLLGGGTQNILLRFSRAGRTYVLRRPPPHLRANSNDTMRREARMLGALKGENVDALVGCSWPALLLDVTPYDAYAARWMLEQAARIWRHLPVED